MATNITMNWRGKSEKRGLTEFTVDKMREIAVKLKKDSIASEADKLWDAYTRALLEKDFTVQKEIELVSEYVRVAV